LGYDGWRRGISVKDELHLLVDELPEDEARLFLDALRRRAPLLRALCLAHFDDEPETEAARRLVAEAREQVARGDVIGDNQLWRRLGHAPTRPAVAYR